MSHIIATKQKLLQYVQISKKMLVQCIIPSQSESNLFEQLEMAYQGYSQPLCYYRKWQLKLNLQLSLKIQAFEQILFLSSNEIIQEKTFSYYRNDAVFILFQQLLFNSLFIRRYFTMLLLNLFKVQNMCLIFWYLECQDFRVPHTFLRDEVCISKDAYSLPEHFLCKFGIVLFQKLDFQNL